MISKNNNLTDVFFHLGKLKSDMTRHIIDNNKDQFLVSVLIDFTKTIDLIEVIIKSYDNQNLKSLTNSINSVLLSDPELHCVTVVIKKKKFLPGIDNSKNALILHLI